MLWLKRLGTFLVLFLFLFMLVFFGSLAVGGAVAGAQARTGDSAPTDIRSGFELGQRAGQNFARRYRGPIARWCCVASLPIALVVSISGVLPWCRKPARPPKLPAVS